VARNCRLPFGLIFLPSTFHSCSESRLEMSVLTSVIVPVRNAEKTLVRALESLRVQTDSNWEAIVVDDGSTDSTRLVATNYAAREPKISVLIQAGAGVAAARNKGIMRARGQRLLFLDGDDWIAPQFLEKLGGLLDADPDASAAYCAFQRVTPDGRLTKSVWSADLAMAPFEVMARRWGAAIHSILIKRALADAVGGFDETLRTCEDWDFWQRVARTGAKFVGLDESLAFYRMSSGSLTQNPSAMISDAARVITRGFSKDDRVGHPASDYATGADPSFAGGPDLALAYFVLWSAAHEIGRRRTVECVFAAGQITDFKNDVSTVVNVIFEGLALGAHCLPSELVKLWPEFEGELGSLLERIENESSRPGLGRRVRYGVERRILEVADFPGMLVLGLTAAAKFDLQSPEAIAPPLKTDRLLLNFTVGDKRLGFSEMPVYGSVSAQEAAELAIRKLGLRTFLRESGAILRPRAWIAGALATASGLLSMFTAHRRDAVAHLIRDAATAAALAPAKTARGISGNRTHLERIVEAARRDGKFRAICAALPTPLVSAAQSYPKAAEGMDRRTYWEAFFVTPDPWNYGSDYERVKFERTLALVPVEAVRALELACAEGHFTELLAPIVGKLIASDISQTALDRAKRRCASFNNLTFEQLDFAVDTLPTELDLIVCSETLYYLSGRAELSNVCCRLAKSLSQGGRLLSVHSFVIKDDLTHTGFDWDNHYGAAVIAETLAVTPEMTLEASRETPLYRIDRFRKTASTDVPPAPQIERMSIGANLEPAVARHVIWGGATIRRADAWLTERTNRLPILMYHRVVEEGPPALSRYCTAPSKFQAQMRWLRSNGYHSVFSTEAVYRLGRGEGFCGRPVLITFDDGTIDFFETAWPILRDCDFSAEVFVVSDMVGGYGTWDAEYGPPSSLMNAGQICALAQQGVRFGSHLATHRAVDSMSSIELLAELTRSRAMIDAWTSERTTALAMPYGVFDERIRFLAHVCGYQAMFTTQEGVAQQGADPFCLPRIEVQGGWNLNHFAEVLSAAR
jgi:peptidoglycan/xylan/chitin deacetylase (PgdA/CDA1 family)/GT2 family glycosyltransferase